MIIIAIILFTISLLLFIEYFCINEDIQKIHNTESQWHYDNPLITYPHNKFKAAFVTFVKNDTETLTKLRYTIHNLEDQFNKHHNYPYLIFTDQELSQEYMELASALSRATIRFEQVDKDLYGYHPKTDLKRAAQTRMDMSQTIFGDSEDYRFQSRFMAGTVYRHPAMRELDFAWRFEAGTEYVCPIDQDLFQYMFENNKTTSFSIALYEYKETMPTLYQTVLEFAAKHPQWIKSDQDSSSLWSFVQDPFSKTFNGCHLWNNFQFL
ncbi:hypothetical protein G6F38_009694 [Rhizopus arrhizus]|nr:hypothetical protein G6F38_009694 [Rhizopus arrhizus]